MTQDIKFEYLEALCNAIEIYSTQLKFQSPHTFIYKKSDLRYAFERSLYFHFADNLELYALFTKWKKSESLNDLKDLNISSSLLRKMAFYITKKEVCLSNIDSHSISLIGHIKRSLGDFKRTICCKTQFQFSNCVDKPEILFLIDHARYLELLAPVINVLDQPYAYLVVENFDLEKRLNQEAKPLISCRVNISVNKLTYSSNLFQFRGLLSLYDIFHKELSRLMPHSVVVVEGNFAEDEIINKVCKKLSIPVYCIQQGWSPIIHNGFRNMSFNKMFVWGDGFAELLKPYNPCQKFISVGSHVLKAEHGSQIHNEKSAISFFLQVPYKLITQGMWLEFLELIKWTAQRFKDIPILIREHPRYPISDGEAAKLLIYSNLQLTPPGNTSLEEVLSKSFLSVSIYSSTILESIAAGTFPIIVNLTSMPRFNPDLDSLGAAVEVKSIERAKGAIDNLVSNSDDFIKYQKKVQKIRSKYFFDAGDKVAYKLAKEISSTDSIEH